jgi:hypothetical protein
MDASPRISNKKRVSFYELVKCRSVVRFPATHTWYSENDYARFKAEAQMIQRCIVVEKVPSSILCTRGLEHLIDRRINMLKRTRRILAWETLETVQEKQWDAEDLHEQDRDDTALAIGQAYAKETLDSQRDAHMRGLQDQYDARFIESEEAFSSLQATHRPIPSLFYHKLA